jgi:hypothetical protein
VEWGLEKVTDSELGEERNPCEIRILKGCYCEVRWCGFIGRYMCGGVMIRGQGG